MVMVELFRHWLCRRGHHSWIFIEMYDVRHPVLPGYSGGAICTLVEGCRRCRLRRTRKNADIPKRVSTG